MRALLLAAVPFLLGCVAHQEGTLKNLDLSSLRPRSSFDLARAIATPNPEGVTFRLEGAPVSRGEQLELSGWLENAASEPRTVIVFPVGPFGFFVEPAPGRGTRRPPGPGEPPRPPPAPPPPEDFELPAQSRVRLTTTVNVTDYDWPPGPMELQWVFHFWNEPRPTGLITVGR